MIDTTLDVPTDGASLSIYDPAVVVGYAGDDLHRFDPAEIAGVRSGLFFGFSTGRDGVFRIRITDGGLTEEEREFAAALLPGLGLRCSSGILCLSGYGFDAGTEDLPTTEIEAGEYRVDIYEILWSLSPTFFSETGEARPERPADYVLRLERCRTAETGRYQLPEVPLRLETLHHPAAGGESPFLYPCQGRRVGTPPGTVLVSTVISYRRSPSGRCLKECGVEGYAADLDDYTGLKWKDRVRFEVVEVDHSAGRFQGRLLTKLLA